MKNRLLLFIVIFLFTFMNLNVCKKKNTENENIQDKENKKEKIIENESTEDNYAKNDSIENDSNENNLDKIEKNEDIIEKINGKVELIVGEASKIDSEGKTVKLKKDDIIIEGDIIKTEDKSVVILSFGENETKLEIQSNSQFQIDKYNSEEKLFSLKKGNVWLDTDKDKIKSSIVLQTPMSQAGVRGTRFYTFQVDENTWGTCHCLGDVEYSSINGKKYKEIHKTDYLTFTRNGKTVLVPIEDRQKAFGRILPHNHSEIDNSPLGLKDEISKEDKIKLMKLMENEFRKLENKKEDK